jgi:amino acid transporter
MFGCEREARSQPSNRQLSGRQLSFTQVLASSLGIMGISGSVVIMIPLVFASAGNGTCLAFLVSMVAYVLVAFQINTFARRIATVGSLYVFVQQGLGLLAGTVVGWALTIGYWAFVPVNAVAVPYYLLLSIRSLAGIIPVAPPALDVGVAACAITLLAWWLTLRGIKLSTRIILLIECATLAIISVVIGGYFVNKGVSYDSAQFTLTDVDKGSLAAGLVLAMSCFTGFEASSVLGLEAKLPLKMIPRANLTTIIITGLAISVSAYALIQSFHGLSPPLDKDEAPMVTLARSQHMGAVAPLILAGVGFSWFGCLIGCFNTGGRLLYSLSRQGKFHRTASQTHPKFNTPHISAALIAISGLGTAIGLLVGGVKVMDIITCMASMAAYGFMTSYIMVSVAAIAYVCKHGERPGPAHILSAFVAVALMLGALGGSFYPLPQWPMEIVPVAFLCALALGVGYFLYLQKWQPQKLFSHHALIDSHSSGD